MFIPLNFTGGTYKDRSKTVSNQSCVNFYPKIVDNSKAKSQYVLQNWVGLKSYASVISPDKGFSRGVLEYKNVLYHVVGEFLYKIANVLTREHILIGRVPGYNPVIMRGFNNGVSIASDGLAYFYDGDRLEQVSNLTLENPNTLDVLNNRVIYQGNDGRFGVSDAGDALTVSALNYATAESNGDDITRVFTYNQRAWFFGEKTIEQWWNSASGSPPFDRVDGGIVQRGTRSPFSVAKNDSNVFFLSDDLQVYTLSGAKLSDQSLNTLLNKYITFDCQAWCMTLEGQEFYVMTFPRQNKTWVLPIGGQWFEWQSQTTGGRSLANGYAYFNNKHIASSAIDGSLYELDFDTYDELGTPIIKTRDTGIIHGGLVNRSGKKMSATRLEIIMNTGNGLLSGQGSDPDIMLSYSDDGGRTFSTERRASIGKLGQFTIRVEWFGLGSFYERIFRLRVSDSIFISIESAVLEVESQL